MPVFRQVKFRQKWCGLEAFDIVPVAPGATVSQLQGEKRIGHLWNHAHGPAEPRMERI